LRAHPARSTGAVSAPTPGSSESRASSRSSRAPEDIRRAAHVRGDVDPVGTHAICLGEVGLTGRALGRFGPRSRPTAAPPLCAAARGRWGCGTWSMRLPNPATSCRSLLVLQRLGQPGVLPRLDVDRPAEQQDRDLLARATEQLSRHLRHLPCRLLRARRRGRHGHRESGPDDLAVPEQSSPRHSAFVGHGELYLREVWGWTSTGNRRTGFSPRAASAAPHARP
jgi:hypothetical protein